MTRQALLAWLTNATPGRLYLVVRSDLSPDPQITRACRAAFGFFSQPPLLVERWHESTNILVIVPVPDEASLKTLNESAQAKHYVMRGPDLGDQMTASAFAAAGAAAPVGGRHRSSSAVSGDSIRPRSSQRKPATWAPSATR